MADVDGGCAGLPVEPGPGSALLWLPRTDDELALAVVRDDNAAERYDPPLPAEQRWLWTGLVDEPETWAEAVARMAAEDLPLAEATHLHDLSDPRFVRLPRPIGMPLRMGAVEVDCGPDGDGWTVAVSGRGSWAEVHAALLAALSAVRAQQSAPVSGGSGVTAMVTEYTVCALPEDHNLFWVYALFLERGLGGLWVIRCPAYGRYLAADGSWLISPGEIGDKPAGRMPLDEALAVAMEHAPRVAERARARAGES